MRSLSLEEFAVVLAHLGHFPPEHSGKVLARLQVPEKAFLDAANTHPIRVAEDLAASKPESSEALQKALDCTSQELAARKPDLDQIPPLPSTCPEAPPQPDVDRTLDPQGPRLASAPMPFRSGPPMPPPAAELRQASDSGDTLGLDADPSDALPFEARDFSSWTVEAHAAFTAERRWLDLEAVRTRYAIRDGADEHALIVHFNRRFAREPGLREHWTELVQRRMRELGRGG